MADTEKNRIVVVGAGVMGLCIAQDLCSVGYDVTVVEREDSVGGVWRKNDYPSLRLQGLGNAWRCLSKVPSFHKSHSYTERYQPTRAEILKYTEELAQHPKLEVLLMAEYLEATKEVDEFEVKIRQNGAISKLKAKTVVLAIGYDPGRSGRPYSPIDIKKISNGATVVHSSSLNNDIVRSCKASKRNGKTYVVGSHKAAMEVLSLFQPNDKILWAIRGHYVFLRSQAVDELAKAESRPSWIASKLSLLPTWLTFCGYFETAENLMLAGGKTGYFKARVRDNFRLM